MTVNDMLDAVLEREGGFVNHPDDHGGPTHFGITLKALQASRGEFVTAEDVQHLSREEAKRIYRSVYLDGPGYSRAIEDERLRALLLDYAVHSGPETATKALQRALGIQADGILGAQTRHFLELSDAETIYKRVLAARINHLVRLVLADPSQRVFLDGWLTRVVDFV